MSAAARRFWPFAARTAVIAAPMILLAGLGAALAARAALGWPDAGSERLVYTAIFVMAALPIVLAFLDTLASRGGSVEFRGLRLNLGQLSSLSPAFAVPANIGVRGLPVTDSSTSEILAALQAARASEIVVIDLEDGTAWWETRLLVLLAGAVRAHHPRVVVFVATRSRRQGVFVGWQRPESLLPLLLAADQQYRRCYYTARSAARQWELIAPSPAPGGTTQPQGLYGPAADKNWMAMDNSTGLPNELAFEQMLQSELGRELENPGLQRSVTISRVHELFAPVLVTDAVSRETDSAQQLDAVLASDQEYLALTHDGLYDGLVQRTTVLNSLIRSLAAPAGQA